MIHRYLGNVLSKAGRYFGFGALTYEVQVCKKILIEQYLEGKLRDDPRYQDERMLNRFEHQVLSQNGEDGILREIFRRIGTKQRDFVEFGVGNGLENNTAALLLEGWHGTWIEGSKEYAGEILREYSRVIQDGRLCVINTYITRENIKGIFESAGISPDTDLLSIDIDGNDFWIWKQLSDYHPRVVVVEYNASLGPTTDWVMPYNPEHRWGGAVGNYFGASLKALEKLGVELGYSLVACNLTGANAFFVRKDLVTEKMFMPPFTAEHFYEKPMYFLEKRLGHQRSHKLVASVAQQHR